MALGRLISLCALAMTTVACTTSPITNLAPATYDGVDADACVLTDRGALVLMVNDSHHLTLVTQIEAGESVTFAPAWTPRPSAMTAVPSRCFSNWRLSDRALASLSPDRSRLTVAATAPVGSTFTLSMRFRGRMIRTNAEFVRNPVIEHRFEVIRRVTSPLVGHWRPVAGACPEGTAITGLAIRDTGRFEVETIMRPNHYQPSAVGNWRVEGDRLVLTPEHVMVDNDQPSLPFQNESRFTLEDGVLRFDRLWHGSYAGRGTCNAPLRRTTP